MLKRRNITRHHMEYLDVLNQTRKMMSTTTHLIVERFKVSTPDAQFILECWQEKRDRKRTARQNSRAGRATAKKKRQTRRKGK